MAQNPLTSVNGKRFLELATEKPAEPNITYEPELYLSLQAGRAMTFAKEKGDDYSTIAPVLSLERRIQTEQDAVKAQLAYLTMFDRYAARTPYNQRLKLIQQNRYKDKTGVLCTYVSGYVVDWREQDGRITRICLMSPLVSSRYRSSTVTPVDSHLWLWTNLNHPEKDYTNPIDRVRNPRRKPPKNMKPTTELKLGDFLMIAGQVQAYTDSQGRRRLGIGEWNGQSRCLLYSYEMADGRSRGLTVPRHLMKHMTIATFDENGYARWADPWKLRDEVDHWKREYPGASSEMQIVHDAY